MNSTQWYWPQIEQTAEPKNLEHLFSTAVKRRCNQGKIRACIRPVWTICFLRVLYAIFCMVAA
jgi:hypothetical protein